MCTKRRADSHTMSRHQAPGNRMDDDQELRFRTSESCYVSTALYSQTYENFEKLSLRISKTLMESSYNSKLRDSLSYHLEGVVLIFLPPQVAYFFLASKALASTETTLPNITTPFPSMKATRERPSQFLKESATKGC